MASDQQHQIEKLKKFIQQHPSLVVLTGAGISAASGIPTYRDHGGKWKRSQPIQHQEFINQSTKRQRYWARSAVGWPMVAEAQPNQAHHSLAKMEADGRIALLVTQNVDRLHQRAEHQRVVDLHGRLDRAICLDCQNIESREALQDRLLQMNPDLQQWLDQISQVPLAPDGDAHVEDRLTETLQVPACSHCGGVLMPDVVFFGGTVPRQRVEQVNTAIESANALLVVGSSLMVYSGYRFCRLAESLGKPIAILNQGDTRADAIATLKVGDDCGITLQKLARL